MTTTVCAHIVVFIVLQHALTGLLIFTLTNAYLVVVVCVVWKWKGKKYGE